MLAFGLPELLIIGFSLFLIWIWSKALLEVYRGTFPGYWRAWWIVLLVLAPALGVVFYYAFGRKQRLVDFRK